jgi:hypothetical protein
MTENERALEAMETMAVFYNITEVAETQPAAEGDMPVHDLENAKEQVDRLAAEFKAQYKRPRGRPRKTKPQAPKKPDVLVKLLQATKAVHDGAVLKREQKRRGRPRKPESQVPKKLSALAKPLQATKAAQSGAALKGNQKRRGRPRKV